LQHGQMELLSVFSIAIIVGRPIMPGDFLMSCILIMPTGIPISGMPIVPALSMAPISSFILGMDIVV
jgi:hypothetical protein